LLVVKRDVWINYDLESKPMEFKTNSTIGSGKRVFVRFRDSLDRHAGGVFIDFSSPPKYTIDPCTPYWIPFQSADLPTATKNRYKRLWKMFPTAELPTATNKLWRITLSRISGIRLIVHCNEKEIINQLISYSTCTSGRAAGLMTKWSRKVAKISVRNKP
jgi:hypothetical protein